METRWLILAVCLLGMCVAYTKEDEESEIEKLKKEIESLKSIQGSLSRQMMMQQLYTEEMTRSGGDSGIKQVRVNSIGTRNYMSNSHTGNAMMSIHDHSNNIRTVGLGEYVAVLNGLEFRTRHNDYGIRMPHPTKSDYQAVQDVPYPDVPPSVLAKGSVKEQIEEMRMYFKAWATQRPGLRKYKEYFTTALCYLEGAWTTSQDAIDEPFESDRHQIDASSWFDLTQKVRFTAYSGRKSNKENYAYLPMKIVDVVNETVPIFAQWNYRILCHPLKEDLPLHRLRLVDDFTSRMTFQRSMEEHAKTRAARFEIHSWKKDNHDKDYRYRRGLLDNLFEEIPGMDNYKANLTDDAFGLYATKWVADYPGQRLNVGYYHRRYKVSQAGAMGTTVRNRGYSDRNVFMAMNSQERIPGAHLEECTGKGDNEVCTSWHQRWSYAIPLEIIYLTPLYNWNPYNIEYKGSPKSKEGKTVTAGGRNGGHSKEKAYNGTRTNVYYRTPAEFFGNGSAEGDPADTDKGVVGVLDKDGNVRKVVATGTRIFLPEIPGLGLLRTRYPVAPLYSDGSTAMKEVEALKDLVTRQQTFGHMFREDPIGGKPGGGDVDKLIEFKMGLSVREPPGQHMHTFEVYESEMDEMIKTGETMTFDTSEDASHTHTVVVQYQSGKWVILSCDGKPICWDEHPQIVTPGI